MRPLSRIATGYLFIVLFVRVHGFDLAADPVAWCLVLAGVGGLPTAVLRGPVRSAAGLALLVSIPLWIPAVQRALDDADPSLAWALSLPALGFVGLLAHGLSEAARDAGASSARRLFSALVTFTAVVAALPVLVFGAHLDGLDPLASALAGLHPIGVLVLLVIHREAPWSIAVPETAPIPDGST